VPNEKNILVPPTPLPQRVEPDRYGFFVFTPSFSYARIDSTDAVSGGSAVFLSKLMPAFELGWGQHWSESLTTRLDLGFQEESYFSADNRTIENASHSRTNFGIAAEYSPSLAPDLSFDFGISFQQEDMVQALNVLSLSMTTVMVPELMLGASYRLVDLAPFSLRAHADALFLFPAGAGNETLNSGYGYDLGLMLTQDISSSWAFSGGLDYSVKSQNSSGSDDRRTDIGATFQLTFRMQ
jgi:hypothetical protein